MKPLTPITDDFRLWTIASALTPVPTETWYQVEVLLTEILSQRTKEVLGVNEVRCLILKHPQLQKQIIGLFDFHSPTVFTILELYWIA
jgi:hypothetical protein